MSHRYFYEEFALDEDQHDNVLAALERAQELADTRKELPPGARLDAICMDFLATNDFRQHKDPHATARYLKKLENVLGLRLVGVNPTTRRIEYGMDTLQWASEGDE